ncbi:MAG: tetratricopeptide repeat protein [Acidobacteria bacterium]|nr:tetratricopeptide repeat protein [Acidobacteriota bacterium]
MKYLASIISILILSFTVAAQDAALERGQVLLTHGAYQEAIAHFNAMLEKQSESVETQVLLLRALVETGEYAAAEKRAREFLIKQPNEARLQNALGEVLLETGRYAEAAAAFAHAAKTAKGTPLYRALLNQARARLAQGNEDDARIILVELAQKYQADEEVNAEALTIFAKAFACLEKYQDANDLYIDARDEDEQFIEAFIAQGELLNEKYNYAEAQSLFEDALKINANSPAALIGLAESKRLSFSPDAGGAIELALRVNPNAVRALTLKAWFQLEEERTDAAMTTIERALAVNPNALEAHALRAAIFYASDRNAELEAETKRALAINAKAGIFFDTLAHFAVIKRRYADGVRFGRRAVELSPKLWRARTDLGIQLLRIGKTAEGRAELEKAFAGDPFNLWAKNTLDLLDSIKDYVDTTRGAFLIKTSPKEAEVVAPYAAELIEEAYKKLTAKYKFTPTAPIAVELFENHEDFAVKALGLPGLGALGVCFGQTIAMDSPSARAAGQFNWGGTLWHEFTHVITLQMTDYKIPRWFSEGLSVFEERRARPGWGDDWSVEVVKAYSDGRFVKIANLDAAFTRPKTPDGVPLAYFQASQVCEFVEEKYGFDTILKMLALYKEGAKDLEVLQQALHLTPEQFDQSFNEFLQAKIKDKIAALGTGPMRVNDDAKQAEIILEAVLKTRPNDYFALLKLGTIYKQEGDKEKAIALLKRAAEVFPYYAREGNPYVQLADLYEAQGQKAEAQAALEALIKHNETDASAYKRLAKLKMELQDRAGALATIYTSFYVTPFDADLHKLAGDAYLEQGSVAEAVREFRVVVSLQPANPADAHYDLARALAASGNKVEAKREVLRALEIAPSFEKAQELLLKLRGEG